MKTIDRCIIEIDQVKRIANGEEVAYVARSRIGRLLVSVASLIATQVGIEPYDIPQRIRIPEDAPTSSKRITVVCNELLDVAKTITQPSEPLDERWRSGWRELLIQLDRLEIELRRLRHEE